MSEVLADPRQNILFLNKVKKSLSFARVKSASAEAEALVRHFAKANRIDYFTGRKVLTAKAKNSIKNAVKARRRGVPLSYITKESCFYGRTFFVTQDTLVPRPETEVLVEETLKILVLNSLKNPQILDVGTGSGCIAASLTIERPDCRMTALDFSGKALSVARKNFALHGLEKKLRTLKSDLFGKFGDAQKGFWDVIVSNPPYIPKNQIKKLSREVRSEPVSALDGGASGLETIEKILKQAPFFLKMNGWLLMEIGAGQSKALARTLLKETQYKNFRFTKDLNGIERVLIAQKN